MVRSKKEWKEALKEAKRHNRLERIEARHQARIKRIETGQAIWLRVLLASIDLASAGMPWKRLATPGKRSAPGE